MTDQEKKFTQLAAQRDVIIKQLKEVNEVLEPLMVEIGNDTLLQGEDGTVYKIQEPKGQYVTFKKIEYIRSRDVEKGDPAKGGSFLSKKEVAENGFKI